MSIQPIEISLVSDDGYSVCLEKGSMTLYIETDASEIEDFTASQGWSFGWKHGMIITDPAGYGYPAQLEVAAGFIDRVMSCDAVEQFAKQFSQYDELAAMGAKEIHLTAAQAA